VVQSGRHELFKINLTGISSSLSQSSLAPTLALRAAFRCSAQSKCLEQAKIRLHEIKVIVKNFINSVLRETLELF